MSDIAASLVPTDAIEWLFVKDITDSTAEIRRYLHYKAAMVDSKIKSKLESILKLPDIRETIVYETSEPSLPLLPWIKTETKKLSQQELEWLTQKREEVLQERRATGYFADGPRDYNGVYVDAFMDVIKNVNQLENLLLSAERRRDGALTKLYKYRASRAASRRPAASKVIDAEYQDISAADAPRNSQTPNDDVEPQSGIEPSQRKAHYRRFPTPRIRFFAPRSGRG